MKNSLSVKDEETAKEIAIEAVRSMWRYTIPSSFYEVRYDEKDKSWLVTATYFEEKIMLKINAVTGKVSVFKHEKTSI